MKDIVKKPPAVVAEQLYQYRMKAGITREVLSALSGVSVNSIASYEQGRRNPKIEAIYTLAKALGCTIDKLCREESE